MLPDFCSWPLPGSGPVGAFFGVVAEAGVDAGVVLDEAAEEPEEIGEAVEVGDRFRWDGFGFVEADGAAFGAAAYGAGDLVGGGFAVGAGEGPVGEDAFDGLNFVDLLGEVLYVFWFEGGGGPGVRGGPGECGAYTEQGALDVFRAGADIFVRAEAAGEAEGGVEFVDGAVGFDAEVGFGDAGAAGEGSLAGVTGHGGYAHLVDTPSPLFSCKIFNPNALGLDLGGRRSADRPVAAGMEEGIDRL